jgi:hypothetical protein
VSIEVHEAKEGLNIADIAGLRPIEDYLHLILVHAETQCGAVETQEFDSILFPFALLCLSEEAMLL